MSRFQLLMPPIPTSLLDSSGHLYKLSHALGGIILHSLKSIESGQETVSEHPGVLNPGEQFTVLFS